MATVKRRLLQKTSSGTYNTLHLETSADVVKMQNGTTVEVAVNSKAATSHTHTAAQVGAAAASHTHAATAITGVLPIAHGGTGVSTLAELQAQLADAAVDGILSSGLDVSNDIVTWAGYKWWVAHRPAGGGSAILAIYDLTLLSTYALPNPTNNVFDATYQNSLIAPYVVQFEQTLGSNSLKYLIPDSLGNKAYIPELSVHAGYNNMGGYNNTKPHFTVNGRLPLDLTYNVGYWLRTPYVQPNTNYIDTMKAVTVISRSTTGVAVITQAHMSAPNMYVRLFVNIKL